MAGLLWSRGGALPAHLIAADVAVHAHGVASVALAGIALADYCRSTTACRCWRSSAASRAPGAGAWAVHGQRVVCGLSWWLLWVPVPMVLAVLAALAGIGLLATAQAMVWSGLGVGAAGLAGSAWLYRCSRHPGRPRLRRIVDDGLGGASLRKASGLLDEVERCRHD